jgi:hypothetical protein
MPDIFEVGDSIWVRAIVLILRQFRVVVGLLVVLHFIFGN